MNVAAHMTSTAAMLCLCEQFRHCSFYFCTCVSDVVHPTLTQDKTRRLYSLFWIFCQIRKMSSITYKAGHLVQSTHYSKKFSKRSTGKVVPAHPMKAYRGSRDTTLLILNLTKKVYCIKRKLQKQESNHIHSL
jgi:hypothetical protein